MNEILFSPSELARIANVDPRTAASRLRKYGVAPVATINGRKVYSPHALIPLLASSPGAKRLGFALEEFIPDNSPVNLTLAKVS